MMDQKLKNAINNYLKPKGFTSIIQKVLYQFSEYKITVKGDKNSDILIFINNEFKI
jgi:hypothetical protein